MNDVLDTPPSLLLRKEKLDDQLDEELQFHIEMRTREFITTSMTPEEARHLSLVRIRK